MDNRVELRAVLPWSMQLFCSDAYPNCGYLLHVYRKLESIRKRAVRKVDHEHTQRETN